MTHYPQEPGWDIPTTQPVEHKEGSSPHPSPAALQEQELVPRHSTMRLPAQRPQSRTPWIIGIGTVLLLIGAGAWYWWVSLEPTVR